ncbi:NAD(P)H-dependent flavin oxidoreductase [Amycolatopsis thermophila]|uniref:NAD(P)H-dependent flavin oxidoreductase YrpB (Nitropropane dioxygenase family) n=1 Tax=Amycolatopsis thermophila TaxID=206084 RepID=A0ABU0F4J8_9PSEU|nr:nitronate monooxygenase [Amycolatopsis thermophila]MDQ0382504.1 NAD(P)H-dependent flavin oxidoreductase YrpB (nitropropane dioxygenase family) [Amycolatopsis thermophila]
MPPILRTPICELLGIDVPLMQAGMGNVAYGRLAAAVSNAGGLGSIGGIDITPEQVDEEIRLFRSLSEGPLCVDLGFPANAPKGLSDVEVPELPGPLRQLKSELNERGVEIKPTTDQAISLADNKKKLEIALDHGVEVIACALGTPTWVVEACHAKGAKVMSIVGLAKHARSAIRNGTDVVIVQGTEGGGHTGDVGLITLLAEVLEFATVPVVAAGGLVKGSQIAACLTAGAQGAWVGTRFLATRESGSEDVFKEAVLEAGYDSTLRSVLFDGLHVRMLRNRFTEVWEGHEDELRPYPVQRVLTMPFKYAAMRANLKSHMSLPSGSGAGMITDLPGAADVLHRLVEETVEALRRVEKTVEFR